MANAVKKTISLSPELAKEAEEIACAEGKTLSAVIQDALRAARAARLNPICAAFKVTGAARPRKRASLHDSTPFIFAY